MTSEVRVFQRKSSVDQSQTWTVTFRNGARESMSVGSNGMTGGLWTIDAVENDDDPNDVTRWVEVFHHSPQQPAPVEEVIRYPREFVRVRNCNSPGWQLYIVDAPGARPRSTLPGLWSGTYRTEESLLAVVNRGDYIEITNQRPRTPAPVETSAAPSQPADVPEVLIGDLTGFDSGDLPPPYSVRMFVDLKGEQRFCLSKVVALVLPWTTTDEELARVKASIIARHAAPVFKELALKRDEYIDVLRKQVDASAAELTTLRERLAGVEDERDRAQSACCELRQAFKSSVDGKRSLYDMMEYEVDRVGSSLGPLQDGSWRKVILACWPYIEAANSTTCGDETWRKLKDLTARLSAAEAERDEARAAHATVLEHCRALRSRLREFQHHVDDEKHPVVTALRADLARAKDALINIGSFFGCSAHLPWFSDDARDEVSAMIDEKGGEKRYDPAFYETYCAQVIADIVTGALSASASGEEADNAELR